MSKRVDRLFSISDGLSRLTHKKLAGLVKEMAQEGVLTVKEKDQVIKGLNKAKDVFYDRVRKELKKVADRMEEKAVPKKTASKQKKRR